MKKPIPKHIESYRPSVGFTFIEVVIIIGILLILTAISVPAFRSFQRQSDLINSGEEIINTLRLAQNKTLASEEGSQWGVWFSTSTSPYQFVLFKGTSFSSRDPLSDKVSNIATSVALYDINLSGGEPEVVFKKIIGSTENYGTISLRLKSDTSKTRQITVNPSGKVTLQSVVSPSDSNRIKDSRRVHLDYSRQIDTLAEVITLTFFYNSSSIEHNITIFDNMRSGQIYWEGEVDVNGNIQKLKIHSLRLNDISLGTQFCIHRDGRYNDKALTIEISGDVSGNLIQYDSVGQTTQGTSVYVSSPYWQ